MFINKFFGAIEAVLSEDYRVYLLYYYLRFAAGSLCRDAQQIAQQLQFHDLIRRRKWKTLTTFRFAAIELTDWLRNGFSVK